MKTYWVLNTGEKYKFMSGIIDRVYLAGISFPFQVKQFRLNPDVVILPNGKYIAKGFFNLA